MYGDLNKSAGFDRMSVDLDNSVLFFHGVYGDLNKSAGFDRMSVDLDHSVVFFSWSVWGP